MEYMLRGPMVVVERASIGTCCRPGVALVSVLAACGAPAVVDSISVTEFYRLSASGLVANQFDLAQQQLTLDDRLPVLTRVTDCRSKRDRLSALDRILQHNRFLREYSRTASAGADYCAAWVRRTAADDYTRNHPAQAHAFTAPREVVDLLKTCVLVKGRDVGCETTYDSYAARFVQAPTGAEQVSSIRLQDENTDDLRSELTRYFDELPGGNR